MIPKITAGGRSFKGAARYYLHDKNANTCERVAWTHTLNVLTDDPDKAWRVMAYTAKEAERLKEASGQKATGRKLEKPVFAYSLAWHPEQDPDKDHMLATARKSLEVLGLTEHEAIIIAHRDEPQRHVHILVNRVHWLTGRAANMSNSKLKLSDFAREYEREHGKIYCPQREDNYRKREQGEKTMYRDPTITEAWKQADSGRSFAAALKDKGYQLAQGRKRLVVVDPYGHTHNPTRHLENVRAKHFNERVADLDLASLPDAAQLSKDIQARHRRNYEASRQYDQAVAEQQNILQTRHHEQRAQVFNHHQNRIDEEREQLTRDYKLDEQRQAIEQTTAKVRNASWWRRWLGLKRRDEERLETITLGYRNAQARLDERITHLECERERGLAALQQRQEQEKALQKTRTRRPEVYLNEQEREQLMERLNGASRAKHPRAGPSLEI